MEFPIEKDENGVPFVQLGDYKFKIDLDELEGSWKDRAINELRETPENVKKGIEEFKKLIQAEPGLKIPLENEAFLLKFLRPCKYYPESAFKVLKKFYGFRIKYPKYARNLTPNGVRHVFDCEVFVFLPSRTPSGARIKVVNVGTKWKPKELSLEDMFGAVMVGVEIAMLEPKTQLGGVEVILNMEGLSLAHITQFSPSLAKLMAYWVQECTPVRLKGIHIINQPYIFKVLFNIFKPFLGEKLRKRLFFHGYNKKSLHDMVSPECLPPYLGGTANIPEYPGKILSEMMFFYEDDFALHNTYGYAKTENTEVDIKT